MSKAPLDDPSKPSESGPASGSGLASGSDLALGSADTESSPGERQDLFNGEPVGRFLERHGKLRHLMIPVAFLLLSCVTPNPAHNVITTTDCSIITNAIWFWVRPAPITYNPNPNPHPIYMNLLCNPNLTVTPT
jgi:hypothetical protein